MPRPATFLLATIASLSLVTLTSAQEGRPDFVWNAETAEHLWNRAGFGASERDIERAVAIGHEAFVAELIAGAPYIDEPFYARIRRSGAVRDRLRTMGEEEVDRARINREIRRDDYEQLRDFLAWWVERMLEGKDPLAERMTLFWHGHFTSSFDAVKNSHEMILQNQLFRKKGLGSFRDLVHEIARDPAMLDYLDNEDNRREHPNENFARELMELFTLGEGNYTETDVTEVARALTGWTDRNGEFRFNRRFHDNGVKTVLGRTGKWDGDDVIDILVDDEACAPYLAGELIEYFEGVAPESERLDAYARLLRETDFDVAALLERLFLDPEFYRDGVLGNRIASPVDYLVGTARRLQLDPPARLILLGSDILGERLFFPPNVKGWDGGTAWITTASLMQRSNVVGVLLGEVRMDDFAKYDPLEDPTLQDDPMMVGLTSAGDDGGTMDAGDDEAMEETSGRPRRGLGLLGKVRDIERARWRPRLSLVEMMRAADASSDREIVRQLTERVLAVGISSETREGLVDVLRDERESVGIAEGELFEQPWSGERVMRRLTHVVLSLPEAQLN